MITVKSRAEVDKMRHASQIVADVMEAVSAAIRPGVTTAHLDAIALNVVRQAGATPSFLGYSNADGVPPFPATICASINEELVHGIPGKRTLAEGDIITIDVGAIWQGYHGDAAATFPVGEVSPEVRRLLDVTQESLYAGIAAAKAKARLGDVSSAVEAVLRAGGFSVVRGYGGHGIGRKLHEDPHIPNHGDSGKGPRLLPGMTLAFEPMANAGAVGTKILRDRWTVVTADGKWCAHYEHTVCIRTAGSEAPNALGPAAPEILTDFSPVVYERIGGPRGVGGARRLEDDANEALPATAAVASVA